MWRKTWLKNIFLSSPFNRNKVAVFTRQKWFSEWFLEKRIRNSIPIENGSRNWNSRSKVEIETGVGLDFRFRVSSSNFDFEFRLSSSTFDFEFRVRFSISNFDFEFRFLISTSSFDFRLRVSSSTFDF